MEIGATQAAIAGGLALAGGFLGKGVDWLFALSKRRIDENRARSEITTSEIEKAAVLHREIICDLRKDLADLVGLLKKLEEERVEYRVENATLKGEIKALKEKVYPLEAALRPVVQKPPEPGPPA